MRQYNNNLIAWQLYDGNGFLVAGSVVKRPRSAGRPKGGNWKQVSISICCTDPSFILFRNTTASANVTSIVSADNAINWSGTLANGDYLIFEIPNSYDESFTIVTSSFSGRTITNTTEQGDGTISTIGSLSSVTNTFTTTATPGSQYLVLLS